MFTVRYNQPTHAFLLSWKPFTTAFENIVAEKK